MGHSTKPLPKEVITGLIEYATDVELKCLRALLREGSYRKAARAAGVSPGAFNSAIRTVKQRAARRGFAPAHGWNPPTPRTRPAGEVPEGFELAARSDLRDAESGELKLSWEKSRQERPEPAPLPEGFVPRKISRAIANGREVIRWESSSIEEERRAAEILAAWERHAQVYAGLAGMLEPPPAESLDPDLVAVLPIGDPHVGLLAWAPETGDHQDTGIVCRELLCCVRELIADMPACPEIIIGNLGDALHAQDATNRTPGHGNILDVDGRYPKVLDALHTVFRGIIEAARAKFGRVRFRNLPGNHDPRAAAELMFWLRAVFERDPRVDIADAYAAHQYDRFGTNLIGWHHGDRNKKGELPAVMAADHDGSGTGWWGETTEHVWHVGHEHHTTAIETPACLVHVHNTLVGRDAYHAGRYRAKRMLEAYTYHRRWGLHTTNTVSLARVRAVLAKGAP